MKEKTSHYSTGKQRKSSTKKKVQNANKHSRLPHTNDGALKIDAIDRQSQRCPQCGEAIGIMPGTRDSICHNCGFKDPCCE